MHFTTWDDYSRGEFKNKASEIAPNRATATSHLVTAGSGVLGTIGFFPT